MKRLHSLVTGLVLSVCASSSWALESFDVAKLTGSQDKFDALTEDFGAALSYKAITPAEPLGLVGFDIGIEATGTSLESVDKWGGTIGNTDLSILPVPKLHVHKGLPLNIDLGLVYSQIPTTGIQYIGGEIRYSFVSGNVALPAIAVRGTYTKLMGIDEIDFSTKGIEATISKGFLMLTPYAGLGQVWASADLSYTDTTLGKVSLTSDVSMFKWFVGLNLNLGLMNLAFEVDQTGAAQSYSAKLGFRF